LRARSIGVSPSLAFGATRTNEGAIVRLRLREEVDILKLLTETSPGGRGHPSVLRYIDNWEQDGLLFIQTELCALGSFGRFLWDYGRKFAKLDEARAWKILAELTEVGTTHSISVTFF
jgi:mitosis inhibitor protein kinase SWE1